MSDSVLRAERVVALNLIREVLRSRGFHGYYCDGMIILDLEKIAEYLNGLGLTEEIALVRQCEWIVRHEIGHAIQIQTTGNTDEAFAEAFAEKYRAGRRNVFQRLDHKVRQWRKWGSC